jgi:cytochrome c
MKKSLLVAILINFLWISPGFSGGTVNEAKALVEEAGAFVQANGEDKGLFEINKGKFVKGELYVFVYDLTATVIGQPVNPKLIGKNLMEVPDADGKLFRKEIVEMAKAKGSGWVDYKYRNPVSNKIELKTTYLRKVNDMVICCGIYKPL